MRVRQHNGRCCARLCESLSSKNKLLHMFGSSSAQGRCVCAALGEINRDAKTQRGRLDSSENISQRARRHCLCLPKRSLVPPPTPPPSAQKNLHHLVIASITAERCGINRFYDYILTPRQQHPSWPPHRAAALKPALIRRRGFT